MIAALFALFAIAPSQAVAAQDTARFQQGVDYRVEARLDETTNVLTGRGRLRYTNNSPSTLDTLYFQQYLNAFRPNSAWARRELEFGVRRFQDLGPNDHAFERLRRVEVDGRAVTPVYPGAPDSTVVAVPLPAPLAPGGTVTVRMDWDARLSTTPRRQGRRGRHHDFAHWYPRIAVFDREGWKQQPLLPQGEFFGEFGSYDVTLDVARDQVIGSTGVPVEGDPGWRLNGELPPPEALRRDAYPARPAEALGLLAGEPAEGRKRVRWRAEDVHHFAWSASPDFLYDGVIRTSLDEAGQSTPLPSIHVLYQPADTGWSGTVARRTYGAVSWLQELFGPYAWPQLTVLSRVERRGGTEFPMLIMNATPSEGLIVHEVAHQWLHGILANDERRAGWLDEGFTDFVTNWYWERNGRPDVWDAGMRSVSELERRGQTQPIALPGEAFRDPATYSAMTYSKTSLVFRMLRELLGEDTFRRVLRAYHDRYRLQHVDEAAFRGVAEEVSGRDLDWFFQQWLHTTDTLDYGIRRAAATRRPDGQWTTRVEVVRLGNAWMPVELRVGDVSRTLESRERSQTVEVVTRTRPREAVLDPRQVLLDLDRTNDRAPVR
ncbi:MAG TPA: M1 family metallopeptidase [Longimicrobiaceae bacterium]|nr:M1 family metallopeptidase [Longimicrobiaceae bacterium]